MGYRLALIGNQNCGKTTLFNVLTGSNQHVGNFPGVTVEKKEGVVKGSPDVTVTDLPGIYSLSPYTSEEVVTRDFLLCERPDAIINIVDATNPERSLYLSLQLLELDIPLVMALNMMDEVKKNNYFIDINGLEKNLRIKIVPVTAVKNDGIDELIAACKEAVQSKSKACRSFFYNGVSERAIEQVAQLIEARAIAKKLSAFYAAAKIVEGDELTEELLQLGLREKGAIEAIIREMERKLGTDREAAIADMRYGFIDKLCRSNFKRGKQSREQRRSVKIDAVLTHRYFALPIFFLIMLAVFWLTFGIIGSKLSASTEFAIAWLSARADGLLTKISVAPMLHSLITDGIFVGVGSVLSFLPTILVLFLMLSILEDTGYMARVAFIMDKLLRKIGLSGRSFVPMLIGFGCSVPAIMATRTLPSERDRKMTALLVPFMSCSAKLPIYAMFTEVFFKKHKALVLISLYILGMTVGVLYGLFFKNTVFKSDPVPFVMELPAYRFPSAKNVLMTIRLRAKDFLVKAFTIIFIASILVWFLQRFDFSLRIVADAGESMLAAIGKLIAPAFAPLGFADWRASTALITGLSAKEAVVSTINVLVSSSGAELSEIFTPLSAYAFLVFTLLYMPCIAAVATIKREIGSAVSAFLAMLSQTAIAWLIAFAVYNIGGLLMR